MLPVVHTNPLVAMLFILGGAVLGLALALSDWKSKFTIGGIIASLGGPLVSTLAKNVETVKEFLIGNSLLTPILYALDIAFGVFISALVLGTMVVFAANLVSSKRAGDPEAFVRAVRRAVAVFGGGLYRYLTIPPDREAQNRIDELERHRTIVSLLHTTLTSEVACRAHGRQHFADSINAAGRVLLQHSFGESPTLQRFRMAFYERRGDRLECLVPINSGTWTAHSMEGFDTGRSFMGAAVAADRPMVYPRDKKSKVPFVKRKTANYKSFVAIPVPCGSRDSQNFGVLTVDYVEQDGVFTPLRMDELVLFSQLVRSLYLLNVKGANDE
jgi:hypothetical protein